MSNSDSDDWHPLTVDQMPPEIRQQWEAECPDGSVIKTWVIAQIKTQLNLEFTPNKWSVEQLDTVNRWLWYQYERGNFFNRRHLRLETLLHDTLAGKVWTLGQRHCSICSGTKPIDHQLPIYVIPVRIAPESRQSLDTVNWRAFQAAIRSRFPVDRYDFANLNHLCLKFTFGLQNSRNDRDLDNMAKSFQDAFSRALDFNDNKVRHLDLIKVVGDFEEEYVIVRVQPSYLNDHSDTIIRGRDAGWAGQPLLRLQDFQN